MSRFLMCSGVLSSLFPFSLSQVMGSSPALRSMFECDFSLHYVLFFYAVTLFSLPNPPHFPHCWSDLRLNSFSSTYMEMFTLLHSIYYQALSSSGIRYRHHLYLPYTHGA